MQWLWDAFWILSRSRNYGMSVGPIPLTEIESYVHLMEVTQVEYLLRAVDSLDRIFLEHHSAKLKTPKKANGHRQATSRRLK